jgi:mono/diheme cytochrome c family protein
MSGRVFVAVAAAVGAIVLLTAPAFAQDKMAQGIKVYADRKCSVCHSIAGKGNAKGPLDEVGTKLTADEIRAWMVTPKEMTVKTKAERKPAMLTYPDLSKPDLEALVAYMVSLKKAPDAAGGSAAAAK